MQLPLVKFRKHGDGRVMKQNKSLDHYCEVSNDLRTGVTKMGSGCRLVACNYRLLPVGSLDPLYGESLPKSARVLSPQILLIMKAGIP